MLNNIVNLYNSAVADYNQTINNLNALINYQNHQFPPEKPDAEIQGVMDIVNKQLTSAKTKLNKISNPDANTALLITQLRKSVAEIDGHITEQQDWLTTYFSKSNRRSMFYEKKITWFGILLN